MDAADTPAVYAMFEAPSPAPGAPFSIATNRNARTTPMIPQMGNAAAMTPTRKPPGGNRSMAAASDGGGFFMMKNMDMHQMVTKVCAISAPLARPAISMSIVQPVAVCGFGHARVVSDFHPLIFSITS